jgi:hypothetical protein
MTRIRFLAVCVALAGLIGAPLLSFSENQVEKDDLIISKKAMSTKLAIAIAKAVSEIQQLAKTDTKFDLSKYDYVAVARADKYLRIQFRPSFVYKGRRIQGDYESIPREEMLGIALETDRTQVVVVLDEESGDVVDRFQCDEFRCPELTDYIGDLTLR